MKKSFYLFLILALPLCAAAQTKQNTKTPQKSVAKPTQAPSGTMPMTGKVEFQTFITDQSIMLNGNFVPPKEYVVYIKNAKGQTIFNGGFVAGGGAHSLDMGKVLPKGEYDITVHEKNNPFNTGSIHLVMQ